MPDSDVPDMTEETSPLGTDLLYMVKDPSGTPLDRQVQIGNISAIGTQTIWAGIGAWVTRSTNGAEYATLELPTNDVMLVSFNFDQTTSEGVGLWWQPPPNWNAGTIRFRPLWTADGGAGTFICGLSGRSYGDNEVLDAAPETGVQTSTDTLITIDRMHIGPYSAAITLTGATKNEPVYLEITRDISDTLTADAKLIGIEIEYTLDATTAT